MNRTGKGGFKDNPTNRNKNGRPRDGNTITETIRILLEQIDANWKGGKKITKKEAIAEVLISKALKGDTNCLRLLLNYIDGMPEQKVELKGEMLWGDLMQSKELNKATGGDE